MGGLASIVHVRLIYFNINVEIQILVEVDKIWGVGEVIIRTAQSKASVDEAGEIPLEIIAKLGF